MRRDAKVAALEVAFRRLPISRRETSAIPYEEVIPGIARQLMLMGGKPTPQRKKVSIQKAKRELERLARLSGATAEALRELSQTAIDLLSLKPEFLSIREQASWLRLLSADAQSAASSCLPTEQRVRQKNPRPVEVARVVALHYFRLTGEKPRRRNTWDGKAYGPFLELLNAVYKVLGVKASADAVLKTGALAGMEF
jgi:hypothetical protein